jgi:hypothetical protein
MKKKYIYLGLGALVLFYLVFRIGRIVYYSHNTEFIPTQYLWIFTDSAANNLDTIVTVGHVRKSDTYYHYLYKRKTSILIFEYKELMFLNIKNVSLAKGVNFDKFLDDFSGEEYNMNLYPDPETYINFKLPFNNSLNVNLDNNSIIKKRIEGKNYRGFFGDVFKMSLSNAQGKQLVLFDYKREATPTLFLLYKHQGRFLVIIINSEEKFDESIIKILKLE